MTEQFHILNLIQGLDIDTPSKELLKQAFTRSNQHLDKLDFQLKRIEKDKTIVINLLNKTIEDLKQQKDLTEEKCNELLQKNLEIEAKNDILKIQKSLLVTQSKNLEDNLRKLEMAYMELEQFSSVASHDLKSPLRNISTYSQLLKMQYENSLDENAKEYLNIIIQGTNYMNGLLDDLLEYSKTSVDASFERIDLNELIFNVLVDMQDLIKTNNAEIRHFDLPEIVANRQGITQLFTNLLENAIKFRSEANPRINIDFIKEHKDWHFMVNDNGSGIDESYQLKVFQPFQKVGNLDLPGTGMGLAICQKVVKIHNGNIWFNSKPSEGTTFHIVLPENPGLY